MHGPSYKTAAKKGSRNQKADLACSGMHGACHKSAAKKGSRNLLSDLDKSEKSC